MEGFMAPFQATPDSPCGFLALNQQPLKKAAKAAFFKKLTCQSYQPVTSFSASPI